ncbi:hypothetical protein glysoja_047906 [Glycine soja]|uniref:Uncharacterized protein n=1 Tax=Glycine soja TaxID=3848 RepID=A0A0B2RJR4_GLYSO|nr:hypothetical protein JHK87_012613 [Glycine soja]KHN32574.1 hypothetical protein glysoja_047906 [Glycine soja]
MPPLTRTPTPPPRPRSRRFFWFPSEEEVAAVYYYCRSSYCKHNFYLYNRNFIDAIFFLYISFACSRL